MSLFGGTGDGGAAAAEAARQANISQGISTINNDFAGFDPKFYNQVSQDYLATATPQLMDQYQNTANNLTYALARQGLSNSSSAASRTASLGQALSLNQAQLASNAQGQANTAEANVASQKNTLINQLESSGDPTVASEGAQAAAAQLRAPNPIQPLGNMFAQWANDYLTPQNNNAANGIGDIWQSLLYSNFGAASPVGASSSYVT